MGKVSRRLNRRTRHRPWPEGPVDVDVAFIAGWCSDDKPSITSAMRQTHDRLVGILGPRKKGPVNWHLLTGRQAILFLERSGKASRDVTLRGYYRELRHRIVTQAGLIVIAECRADADAASTAASEALRQAVRETR